MKKPVNASAETEMKPSVDQDTIFPSSEMSDEEAQQAFTANSNRMIKEGQEAGEAALLAMRRIAPQILGHDNSQALVMRDMLLSLFNGHVTVALSEVGRLDQALRKDLCTVIFGLNYGVFGDYRIRDEFIAAGDRKAAWFLSGLPKKTSNESLNGEDYS